MRGDPKSFPCSLSYVGPVTWRLAKNLSVRVAKPDRYLIVSHGQRSGPWSGLRQSRGLHQLPEHACRWIWLRPPRESWVALGCRSASGAGEEAFGDGSDRLALDLGLKM